MKWQPVSEHSHKTRYIMIYKWHSLDQNSFDNRRRCVGKKLVWFFDGLKQSAPRPIFYEQTRCLIFMTTTLIGALYPRQYYVQVWTNFDKNWLRYWPQILALEPLLKIVVSLTFSPGTLVKNATLESRPKYTCRYTARLPIYIMIIWQIEFLKVKDLWLVFWKNNLKRSMLRTFLPSGYTVYTCPKNSPAAGINFLAVKNVDSECESPQGFGGFTGISEVCTTTFACYWLNWWLTVDWNILKSESVKAGI